MEMATMGFSRLPSSNMMSETSKSTRSGEY